MTTPVVVSRIQNRRGTQNQFDNIYPPGFDGNTGYNGVFNPSTVSNAVTTNTGTVVTIQCDSSRYPVGTAITVAGVTPSVYNGDFVVASLTPTSISYNSTATGTITVAGEVYPTYNSTLFPNVLLPGEMALCTDSRRLFVGNLNGGFVELSLSLPENNLQLLPIVLQLAPNSPSWTPIVSIPLTPFYTIIYDITDSLNPDWNAVGTNFSKNGKLEIATTTTDSTISDTGTEINLSMPGDISFKTDVVGPNIQLSYRHDLPYTVTFSTGSINWLPF